MASRAREAGDYSRRSVGPYVNQHKASAALICKPRKSGADPAATAGDDNYSIPQVKWCTTHGTSHAICFAVFLMYLVMETPST